MRKEINGYVKDLPKGCITETDIFTDLGVLLCPKMTVIDSQMIERLSKYQGKIHAVVSYTPKNDSSEEIIKDFALKSYEKILNGDLTLHNLPKTNWSSIEQGNKVIAYRESHRDEPYALPASYKAKTISEACIKCGTCVRNCPVDAIDIENKTFNLDLCIGCWGCINRCPKHAITSTSKEMNEIMTTFSEGFKKRLEPEIFM